MRAAFLVLLLVVAGCAHRAAPPVDDQVMPDDFAGTVAYENGSVPPPYHFRWTVTFNHTTATVAWQPGYADGIQPWEKTVDITADQRTRLYERLTDLDVFDMPDATEDGMVGGPGGHFEITARGRTYDPGSLGGSEDSARLLKDVAGAFQELVPVDVWHDLRDKQDDWSARQPK
jgi:hypothetical protein